MMNKFGFALGVATVATLTGCLDPEWARKHPRNDAPPATPTRQQAVDKPVEPQPDDNIKPVDLPKPVQHEIIVDDQPDTPPAPVQVQPVPSSTQSTAVAPVQPAEQTTVYIVQRGDTLSKISKRFNIKIDAIKARNPQIKGDVVKLGQKLTLPGAVEVGEQKVPEGAFAVAPKPAQKEYKPYAGPTKEYVVKSGDTLGGIAHANGVSTRQLKELNGLEKDVIRVGQKLLVPAAAAAAAADKPKLTQEKATAAVKPVVKSAAEAAKKPAAGTPAVAETAPAAPEALTDAAGPDVKEPAVDDVVAPVEQPAADYIVYTVKDGEDITGISINYDVSPSEIRQLNNLSDDAQLTAGMELKLPVSSQR